MIGCVLYLVWPQRCLDQVKYGEFPLTITFFDNLTNNNYNGNLVQVIDIDIRYMIDSEEGVFSTLNVIKNKTKKQTQ